ALSSRWACCSGALVNTRPDGSRNDVLFIGVLQRSCQKYAELLRLVAAAVLATDAEQIGVDTYPRPCRPLRRTVGATALFAGIAEPIGRTFEFAAREPDSRQRFDGEEVFGFSGEPQQLNAAS